MVKIKKVKDSLVAEGMSFISSTGKVLLEKSDAPVLCTLFCDTSGTFWIEITALETDKGKLGLSKQQFL